MNEFILNVMICNTVFMGFLAYMTVSSRLESIMPGILISHITNLVIWICNL